MWYPEEVPLFDDFTPTDLADDAETLQDLGILPTWLLGVVLPALFSVYGIFCIANESAMLVGRGMLHITGTDATALGVSAIALGAFLTSKFLLSRFRWTAWFWPLPAGTALLLFLASFGFVAFRILTG